MAAKLFRKKRKIRTRTSESLRHRNEGTKKLKKVDYHSSPDLKIILSHIAEKQRLEEIERQEEENLHGKRNVEQEALSRILESRGLKLYEIPSDGDCMFAALGETFAMLNVLTFTNSVQSTSCLGAASVWAS